MHHEQIEAEADSLLHHGHSKDKRPDLWQYRQLLGTIDPAGIPLVSATLAGNGADDPLYYPIWQRMASVIGHNSFVFLADCQAAAIATRAQIAAKGGIYCFPAPLSGQNPLLLKQWVLNPPAASVDIRWPQQEANDPALGRGFEVSQRCRRVSLRRRLRTRRVDLGKFWLNPETGKWVRWHERYLVVYSTSLASAHIRGLHQRLNQAQIALDKLAAKPGDDLEQLEAKVEALLKRHRVNEFFAVTTTAQTVTQTRHVRRGRQ